MVIGLAAQDTGEQVLEELGMDKIRLKAPVHHGDTLYAFTEVLEKTDTDRTDAGIVRFKHFGINQHDKLVFEGERTVLMKRRALRAIARTQFRISEISIMTKHIFAPGACAAVSCRCLAVPRR